MVFLAAVPTDWPLRQRHRGVTDATLKCATHFSGGVLLDRDVPAVSFHTFQLLESVIFLIGCFALDWRNIGIEFCSLLFGNRSPQKRFW